jgi:hypothetical protein
MIDQKVHGLYSRMHEDGPGISSTEFSPTSPFELGMLAIKDEKKNVDVQLAGITCIKMLHFDIMYSVSCTVMNSTKRQP